MYKLGLYTDYSLTTAMITSMIVYAVGIMQFLTPFAKRKAAVWAAGAVYSAVIGVMYFVPEEFSNLAAYGAAIISAFAAFTLLDRRNYPQKVFLAFTYFSVRWLTGAVTNVLWLAFYMPVMGWVVDNIWENYDLLISFYVISDALRAVLHSAIMYFMIKIFHKVFISKSNEMSVKEAVLLILPNASNINNYRMLLYFNSIDTREINVQPYDLTSLIYYIVSYAALIAMIWFFEQIKAAQRKEKENAMLVVQTGNIRDYISGAESLYRDIRAIRHDMRNHLAVLESLHARGENERFDSYLAEVRERIGSDTGISSGDPVTDVILTEKQSEAARNGISFECDFHCPTDFSAGALDMSIILNNALNNAIEAASQCLEGKRHIRISSLNRKKAFVITVTNSCTGDCTVTDGGLPETTKADSENHGFGLLNIKNTAEKYGGGIDIECGEGEFTLTVMLITT